MQLPPPLQHCYIPDIGGCRQLGNVARPAFHMSTQQCCYAHKYLSPTSCELFGYPGHALDNGTAEVLPWLLAGCGKPDTQKHPLAQHSGFMPAFWRTWPLPKLAGWEELCLLAAERASRSSLNHSSRALS